MSVTLSDLQAHWRRGWIRAPGHEDDTTRVHWMQCGALFADIRVPLTRPDLSGKSALCDLEAEALCAVMRAEGFAGVAQVDDDVCTWHREVNWHGASEEVDAGLMSFTLSGDLIEDGVTADYTELWHPMPARPMRASRVRARLGEGVFVCSDSWFLLGLGQPSAPSCAPLLAALARGEVPPGLDAPFRGLYAYGAWDGRVGRATLCTNPFLEGRDILWQAEDGALTCLWQGFDGAEERLTLRCCD